MGQRTGDLRVIGDIRMKVAAVLQAVTPRTPEQADAMLGVIRAIIENNTIPVDPAPLPHGWLWSPR